MKNILLSANSSWYLYNFRYSTIIEALDRGYQVTCLSPEDSYSKKLIKLGCLHHPISFQSKTTNPLLELALIVKFFWAYFRIKPNIVFHFTVKNNIYGTFAAAIHGIPTVNNISGMGTAFLKKNFLSSLVLFLYKLSQRFAKKIFCQNIEDLNFLIKNRIASESKLILIPGSGVNTSKFHPNLKDSHKQSNNNKEFTFLYAGRMLYDKGLRELIEAFKSLNFPEMKCNLILCGFLDVDNISAITESDLKVWEKISGVEWIGPSDNVELIMARADCVVLPSYREGMPKSLLEAGAMGLPVIATNVPGCRSIVKNELNGYLCEPYSSESLKDAMTKIINLDKEGLIEMGVFARNRVVKDFDEQLVINFFFEVLQDYS